MVTFDDVLDITAKEQFILQESNRLKGEYLFESSSSGKELLIKQIPSTGDLPMWNIKLNDEQVTFTNPGQLLMVNTVIKGLVMKNVEILKENL